jgi:hypothetical protein
VRPSFLKIALAVDPIQEKKNMVTHSLRWPSPMRHSEPEAQPPAKTMPMPKIRPPSSEPIQNVAGMAR